MVNVYVSAVVFTLGVAATMPAQAQEADPTRPPERVEQVSDRSVEVSDYRLTSVWYRGANAQGRSSAVINGRRIEQGDEVGPYVVEVIEPGQVLLKNDGSEMWLRVFRSGQLTIEPSRG